ncbi:MAG: LysR family transcriptional regulator [Pseudonocardiaceae bacterium]
MGVEIRHLRAFLAIAQERSISRAARRLHVAQPALSRTLTQLERELRCQLMARSPGGVTLTPDGEAFHAKAVEAIEAFDAVVTIPPTQPRCLRVGHAWAGLSHYTTCLLREWRATHPGAPIELRRIDDPYAGLTSRRTDVAVLRDRLPDAGFETQLLYQERRMAALPLDDPLATRSRLRLSDLAGRRLVLNSTSGTTSLNLWPADQAPVPGIEVGNVDDWLSTIAAGVGVGVTPASTAEVYSHPDIRYVPLVDAPSVRVHLAWPARGAHPAVEAFVRVAQDIVHRC